MSARSCEKYSRVALCTTAHGRPPGHCSSWAWRSHGESAPTSLPVLQAALRPSATPRLRRSVPWVRRERWVRLPLPPVPLRGCDRHWLAAPIDPARLRVQRVRWLKTASLAASWRTLSTSPAAALDRIGKVMSSLESAKQKKRQRRKLVTGA